eukprot:gene8957-1689_t
MPPPAQAGAWQRVPKGGKQSGGSSKREEWCCACSPTNWADTRRKCRRCGTARPGADMKPQQPQKPAPKKSATQQPPSQQPPSPNPAPSPWARAASAPARVSSLSIALDAAKAAGGCSGVVAQLESELAAARKAAVDDRSVQQRIDGCRAYIERAEKRAAAAEAAVKEALARQDAIAADLVEHRAKLAGFEREANAQPQTNPPVAEVALLRAQLAACTAERDALRAAQGSSAPAPAAPTAESPQIRPPVAPTAPVEDGVEDGDAGMDADGADKRGRSPAMTPPRRRVRSASSPPPLAQVPPGTGARPPNVSPSLSLTPEGMAELPPPAPAAGVAAPHPLPPPPVAGAGNSGGRAETSPPPSVRHTFYDTTQTHISFDDDGNPLPNGVRAPPSVFTAVFTAGCGIDAAAPLAEGDDVSPTAALPSHCAPLPRRPPRRRGAPAPLPAPAAVPAAVSVFAAVLTAAAVLPRAAAAAPRRAAVFVFAAALAMRRPPLCCCALRCRADAPRPPAAPSATLMSRPPLAAFDATCGFPGEGP